MCGPGSKLLKSRLNAAWYALRRGKRGNNTMTMRFLLSIACLSLACLGTQINPQTYHNPVQPTNCADPAVVRGLDGYYYLYVTTTPIGSDRTPHLLPIYRSTDMVNWKYAGDALKTPPDWGTNKFMWAPDVHYINGRYHMYYTMNGAKELPAYGTPGSTNASTVSAIGLAVADTPLGPFEFAGPSAGGNYTDGPVVPPRAGSPCSNTSDPACYNWVFDSFVYQDASGQRRIYDGSFSGGNVLALLSNDGMSIEKGSNVQFGHTWRYEASFVVPHTGPDGLQYYYMLSSQSDCCSGSQSPYSVVASRSTNPGGPFIDQNGLFMQLYFGTPRTNLSKANLGGEGGGYSVIKQNGNGFVGVGGQATIKDLAGQDWLCYHGVVESGPTFFGGLDRQFFIDPLFWTEDGWPMANNDTNPSVTNIAPITVPLLGDNFNTNSTGAPNWATSADVKWSHLSGNWSTMTEAANVFVRQTSMTSMGLMKSQGQVSTNGSGFHFELDARAVSRAGSFGAAVTTGGLNRSLIALMVDVATNNLSIALYDNMLKLSGSTSYILLNSLINVTEWHRLIMEYDINGTIIGSFENEDQQPLTRLTYEIAGIQPDTMFGIALITNNSVADFDNVALATLANTTATPQSPTKFPTFDSASSDEFGGKMGSQWHWLREDAALHGFSPKGALSLTSNGCFDESARLNLNATSPPDLPITKNILLQSAPTGDFMIETSMHFNPQSANLVAGMMVYSDDDHNVWVAIGWNGVLTMIESLRNTLIGLTPPATACPMKTPMSGAQVAIHNYTATQCPAQSDHSSQEYPVNFNKFQPNGQAGADINPSNITAYLRIYKDGSVFTPWYSHDNMTWDRADAWTLNVSSSQFPFQIGLFAQNNQFVNKMGANAWFDYLHVYH